MEKYIFILFIILLIVLIVVVYFGYSKLNHISVNVNRNTKNISAIQSLLGNHPFIANNMSMDQQDAMEDSDDEIDRDVDDFRNREFDYLESTVLNKKNRENEEIEIDNNDDNDDYVGNSNKERIDEEEEGEEEKEEEEEEEVEEEEEGEKKEKGEKKEREKREENEEREEKEEKEKEEKEEKKYGDIMERIDDMKTIEIESINKKKKSVPNKSPKDYDVGFMQLSENDGKNYEVVANKNGVKRWKLVK